MLVLITLGHVLSISQISRKRSCLAQVYTMYEVSTSKGIGRKLLCASSPASPTVAIVALMDGFAAYHEIEQHH